MKAGAPAQAPLCTRPPDIGRDEIGTSGGLGTQHRGTAAASRAVQRFPAGRTVANPWRAEDCLLLGGIYWTPMVYQRDAAIKPRYADSVIGIKNGATRRTHSNPHVQADILKSWLLDPARRVRLPHGRGAVRHRDEGREREEGERMPMMFNFQVNQNLEKAAGPEVTSANARAATPAIFLSPGRPAHAGSCPRRACGTPHPAARDRSLPLRRCAG